MTKRRGQQGFALLLTLVLVMIAGASLAAVARNSAVKALEAVDQTEALQRRWAVTSCRATLLPRAGRVIDKANAAPLDENGDPLPGLIFVEPKTHVWVSLTLSGIPHDLVFTDEQAKFQPTFLQMLSSKYKVSRSVRALADTATPRGGKPPRVVLRPMIGVNADGTPEELEDPEQVPVATYAGYGQLFDEVSPRVLLGSKDRPGVSQYITCWGNGRVLLNNASTQVFTEVFKQVLKAESVGQVLSAYQEDPSASPSDWFSRVTGEDPQQALMAEFLVAKSSRCQGLWVVARGKTRSWYTFSVREYWPPGDEDAEEDQASEEKPAGSAKAGSIPSKQSADDQREGEDASETEPEDPYRRYDFSW